MTDNPQIQEIELLKNQIEELMRIKILMDDEYIIHNGKSYSPEYFEIKEKEKS